MEWPNIVRKCSRLISKNNMDIMDMFVWGLRALNRARLNGRRELIYGVGGLR